MIFFLVNNNYQMIDVYEHCESLREYHKSLIQIPHTLNIINENDYFNNIFTFYSPFKNKKDFLNILKVKKIEQEIQTTLTINQTDILFVYTEYEILNQYIINLFKKSGARVYVIEDGGFPTYLRYSVKNEGKLTLRERIKLFYLNHTLGYKFTEFLKYNNIISPQINEKFLDGVLLYLDVSISRNIKKFLISKNQKKLKLDEYKAVFLNEKIYDYYCTKDTYEVILKDCIEELTNKFLVVYFKFHPRETEENKKWQLEIIKEFSNLEIIEEKTPIENILEKYDAKYVFSFLSAALLNVNAMGAIPVYIYHLYDTISQNSVFKNIDLILKNVNYEFINKNFELGNVGFANTKNDYRTIVEFIREIQ